jgi:hypothetical protein
MNDEQAVASIVAQSSMAELNVMVLKNELVLMKYHSNAEVTSVLENGRSVGGCHCRALSKFMVSAAISSNLVWQYQLNAAAFRTSKCSPTTTWFQFQVFPLRSLLECTFYSHR